MPHAPSKIPLIFSCIALLGFAATAGFFYAYSSTVMVGLDAAPPKSAIEAMQAINREVRNFWFALSFFGAPLYAAAAALICFLFKEETAAKWLALALFIYLAGSFFLTVIINVPMNNELANVDTNQADDALKPIWTEYSSSWTFWNTVRTIPAMVSTLFTGLAIYSLGRK